MDSFSRTVKAVTAYSDLIELIIRPFAAESTSILFPFVATAMAFSLNAGRILTPLFNLLLQRVEPLPTSSAAMLPAPSTATRRDPDIPRNTSPEIATGTENLARPDSKFNNRRVEAGFFSPEKADFPVITANPTRGIARLAAISPPNSVTHITWPDLAETARIFPPGSDK